MDECTLSHDSDSDNIRPCDTSVCMMCEERGRHKRLCSVVPGSMLNALPATQPENMPVCFICTLLKLFLDYIHTIRLRNK
jgi:hypothetical protein